MQRSILIEFNELCPTLLEKWMTSGDLPALVVCATILDFFGVKPLSYMQRPLPANAARAAA